MNEKIDTQTCIFKLPSTFRAFVPSDLLYSKSLFQDLAVVLGFVFKVQKVRHEFLLAEFSQRKMGT